MLKERFVIVINRLFNSKTFSFTYFKWDSAPLFVVNKKNANNSSDNACDNEREGCAMLNEFAK